MALGMLHSVAVFYFDVICIIGHLILLLVFQLQYSVYVHHLEMFRLLNSELSLHIYLEGVS